MTGPGNLKPAAIRLMLEQAVLHSGTKSNSIRSQVLYHFICWYVNVWKRYLFANPVTYSLQRIQLV